MTVQNLACALPMGSHVRHDTKLTADFVASIQEQGVARLIVAVCRPEGVYRIRFRHRTTLGAIEAGQQTVLVVAATDEATDDTEVERLVGQYAQSEHRTGLSTGTWVG